MEDCHPQQVRILLAEDDDGHAELIVEHLRDVGITNQIRRFRDGDEVWQYLIDPDSSEGVDQHSLLLLDIRMPRLDGTEVLRRIKANKNLHRLPVIMLTTTDDPHEIERCYALGCNAYVIKPVEFAAFSEALRRLGLFLMVVRLPKGPITEDSP